MFNSRAILLSGIAGCALMASAASLFAGGFAVRQHSTSGLGSAYAGAAAGGDLSSMYWNPAAATVKDGLNSESHYTLMAPQAEVNVLSASNPAVLGSPFASGTNSGEITSLALISASYYNYQFKNYDPNLFLGLAINSPFGLKTKPENGHYAGALIGRESYLRTFNFSPTLAYKITPQISVAVGAQFQYATAKFSFATGTPMAGDTKFEGNGISAGWTAGVLWQPTASTSIGLGYRSGMKTDLDGAYINTPGAAVAAALSTDAQVKLNLPDMITLSFRQSLTQNMRVLGTVEWTNWSVLKELRVVADGSSTVAIPGAVGSTIANLPVGWTDGWFFGLGGEYDYNQRLTLRAGGAYEITPIDAPTKRLIGTPDNDRIWASIGATYKWSETTSFDLAYSHVFIKDSTWDRTSLGALGGGAGPGVRMTGTMESSLDIISVSMKSRW